MEEKAGQRRSVEKVFKRVDEPLDVIRELNQKWHDRLRVGNLRIPQRYREEKLYLAVRLLGTPAMPCEFIAMLKGTRLSDGDEWQYSAEERCNRLVVYDGALVDRIHQQKQFVLVDDVQPVKCPQCVIPTLVWLERIDPANRVLTHALYLGRRGFKHLRIPRDWESRLIGDARFVASDDDELAGEMIQRGTKVEENIANNYAPTRGEFALLRDAYNLLAGLRIALYQERVVFRCERVVDSVQLADVLVGPFNLQ